MEKEYTPRTFWLSAAAAVVLSGGIAAPALAERVLFIRGADRSGGFLEAGNDFGRTEQLADITNFSEAGGNHGWGTLATTLTNAGFELEQMIEPLEANAPATGQTTGAPIAFETMDLSVYDVIVFGSNNAVYGNAQVDAIENYVRGGGSTIFISDANFGSSWADASDSDQQFLDRFGIIMHQDQGTYSLFRDEGDFLVPEHPILVGVDRYDGEGVTPARIAETVPEGVDIQILAEPQSQTRLNDPPFTGNQQGGSRPPEDGDGVLIDITASGDGTAGRVIIHFDRNTFFNQNGAGTN
ncbi:MAG: hypothetical protein AAF743_16725, partial [Planctomycetota bacterium]